MKKVSSCCNAKVHHQNGFDYCTNCVRILENSETSYNLKSFIWMFTGLFFFYMIFNVSYANAPYNLVLNKNFAVVSKPLVYSIDCMQIKIIEGNKSNAVSVAGATGNMQIMPVTLNDWNGQHKNKQFDMSDMTDENKNVLVGKWMLEERIPEILKSSNIPLTVNHILIAYNWGCGNLINWYKSGAVIARLPNETQQYICKYWAKAKI